MPHPFSAWQESPCEIQMYSLNGMAWNNKMRHGSQEEAYPFFCFLGMAKIRGISQESNGFKKGAVPPRNVWETKHNMNAKKVLIV